VSCLIKQQRVTSKKWIAGAVVGALVGVAIVVGLIIWGLYSRKKDKESKRFKANEDEHTARLEREAIQLEREGEQLRHHESASTIRSSSMTYQERNTTTRPVDQPATIEEDHTLER
jgi:FtsZ-interacting cell division protein ZipA